MIEEIKLLQQEIQLKFPPFYIEFLVKEQLIESRLFSDLALLYGITDLNERYNSSENFKYLPGYLIIGDNSGGYGFFINCKQPNDTNIYVTGLGDMDETGLENIASSFDDWKQKKYDSEGFLQKLYENKIVTPLHWLQQKLIDLEKEERKLKQLQTEGKLALKEYLLKKREIKPQIEQVTAQLIEMEAKQKAFRKPKLSLAYFEKTYNFNFPILYKKLFNDKMLDWGELDGEWYEREYKLRKQSPPFLFFAKDFELLPAHTIGDVVDDFMHTFPDLIHKFIPFAMSGAGDHYAFYPAGEIGGDIPLVFIWHDDNKCDFLSKNLQDFIFLKMLEAVSDIDNRYDDISKGDLKQNTHNWLTTHKKYLKESQVYELEKIYTRQLTSFTRLMKNGKSIPFEALLSDEEYDLLIKQEINFEKLHQSFPYEDT